MLWIREVNKSLKEYVEGAFKEEDNTKVFIEFPNHNKEVTDGVGNEIVLHLTGIAPNKEWTDLNNEVRHSMDDRFLDIERNTFKYSFNYQIDLWSYTPQDRDRMSFILSTKFPQLKRLAFTHHDNTITHHHIQNTGSFLMENMPKEDNFIRYRYSIMFRAIIPVEMLDREKCMRVLDIDLETTKMKEDF